MIRISETPGLMISVPWEERPGTAPFEGFDGNPVSVYRHKRGRSVSAPALVPISLPRA